MDLLEAIQSVKIGRAICFLGAGFSRGATDAQKRPVFGEWELRKALFEIVKEPFDENIPLADIANYCKKKSSDTAEAMRLLLLERFTLTNASPDQVEILSHPWRSTFTTNYDDLPEQIWSEEHIQVFSPIDPEKTLLGGKRLFYLHGRGRDIRSPDTDPLLVLTSSDYAKKSKAHQRLRDYFSNEMATSEAIIFIGYSARDLDFTRSLAALGGQVRQRTLFIEAPNLNGIDRARLEEYGSIETIGTEGFAKALRENPISDILANRPKFVRQITLNDTDRIVPKLATDLEVHRQFITGNFDAAAYAAQKQEPDRMDTSSPIIVDRTEKLDRVFQHLKAGNLRIVVTADVGNGKTFFLRQVEQRGLDEGYRVYRIDGSGPEYSGELQELFSKPGKKLFVIDDAIRHRFQIELIGRHLTNDCGMVLSNFNSFDRIGVHDMRTVVGGQIFEISVDKMTSAEVEQWRDYLNNWGLWGETLGGLTESEKIDHIVSEFGAEIRSTVIGVYRSSKLAAKISAIANFFLGGSADNNNMNGFVGAVITSLVDKHVSWKNVADWLRIDEARFLTDIQNSPISSMLVQENGEFGLPSKQLARFFLESDELSAISANDISNIYVEIVLGTARQMKDPRQSYLAKENLKELMRFRILSLLFGSDHDALNLISVIYNKLSANREIQYRDQFWLQFAMARMADADLHLAETYLAQAIGIARGHGQDWDTKQIDDQYSRLWLQKAVKSDHPNRGELRKAIKHLLTSLGPKSGDVIYPLRSAKYLEPLLEKHIDEIDVDTRAELKALVDKMIAAIGPTGKITGSERGESEVLRRHLRRARIILQTA